MKNILLLIALTFFLSPADVRAEKPGEAIKKVIGAKKESGMSESDKALMASAQKKVAGLSASEKAKALTLMNTGSSADIQKVDGFGEQKAKNVIKKRPFTNLEDVIMVDLVGENTFDLLLTWAKGQQKETADKKPADKKAKEKPATKAEKKPATPEATKPTEKKPTTPKAPEADKEALKKAKEAAKAEKAALKEAAKKAKEAKAAKPATKAVKPATDAPVKP